MSVVQLGISRCRMAASNCFRLQFATCITAVRLFTISPLRRRQSLVQAAVTNQENVGVLTGNCGCNACHQRRYLHVDNGAAERKSTAPVAAPPLPMDVFNRTVTVPKEVIERLVSASTGTGSGSTGHVTYNAVWMRENCRCSQCHNFITEQRNVVFHRLRAEAFDVQSVLAAEDGRLEVRWSDGHVSRYDVDWLEKVALPAGIAGHHTTVAGKSSRYARRLWDSSLMSDIDHQLERVEYGDLVESSQTAHVTTHDVTTAHGAGCSSEETEKSRAAAKSLLGNLLRHGFAFVDNAPADKESTMAAVERICPPLRTFYGENWTFGVTAGDKDKDDEDALTRGESSNGLEFSDTAYLDVGIGVHTDGTYWTLPPGIQVLHCIRRDVHGTGGDTLLVDGFDAAERLRRVDRASFDLLTSVRLNHYYIEPGKFEYRSSEPILRVFNATNAGDGEMEMEWIRYNPYDRTSINTVTAGGGGATATQAQVYAALARLGRLVDDPSAAIRLRLTPGRILFFDNWRVLHARTAFTGERIVSGCYLHRDDWISRAQSLGLLGPTYS